MTLRKSTSTSISRTVVSLLLAVMLLVAAPSRAQGFLKYERDSVALFQGFAVSADLVGLLQMQLSDYGQYEAALRLNLHDQYFPIFELGYGKASHEHDEVTGISYKTSAPYFRIGCDFNLARQKHSGNRIYAGLRYAFTSYKVDIVRDPFPDPVWLWDVSYGLKGQACSHHWAEVVLGIDAKVAGPLHLGWSVRYKRRLHADTGSSGKTWYVPGFGTYGSTKMGGTFNVIIDI